MEVCASAVQEGGAAHGLTSTGRTLSGIRVLNQTLLLCCTSMQERCPSISGADSQRESSGEAQLWGQLSCHRGRMTTDEACIKVQSETKTLKTSFISVALFNLELHVMGCTSLCSVFVILAWNRFLSFNISPSVKINWRILLLYLRRRYLDFSIFWQLFTAYMLTLLSTPWLFKTDSLLLVQWYHL